MAVGDKVRTTRDIQSFDRDLRIRADAIPSGTLGEIIQQDNDKRFIAVSFENGINGTFGAGLVDGLDSVVVIVEAPSPDIMRPEGESTASVLRST